ncbi:fungal-specific transcription factor domain-containing protein [Aspergillus avenaceus]|uniref:Fungal-specific transcription factor domain-containing protein n=1 Tax=Aspergillus avenaceus TaxID=36643 RepID=A0A5N6U1E8_ASPAV|nr:fungal-specific transcription factor domain-containing protein [Aspergillus avenaceus]
MATFKQYYLPSRTGFSNLTIQEVPKPRPQHGQILVRIKAVSLNWRDGAVATGTYPFPGPEALVPCSDGAGIIEELGPGITEWSVGDRVVANFTQAHVAGRLTPKTLLTQLGGESQGLLGQYFIFSETGVVRIPDYLSFEEAACLPCAAVTAWNALYGLVPVRPGQVVLLQGTGGVSTFALQIAVAAGAITIVTSSSDEKLSRAKGLGATHTINYRRMPDWAGEVKRVTGGRGADHIVEIGGTLTLQASFDAVAMHGIIHCIGHVTNPDPLGKGRELRGPDAAFLALDRLCVLRGVVVGSREQFCDMLACFEARGVRPVVDRVFGFEGVKEAYDRNVKRRNGSKHDKTGCLTCRYRKKKCIPNTFPVCGACKRLNLECVREPTRQVLRMSVEHIQPSHGWVVPDEGGRHESSRRRHAMTYYISVLSQLLAVTFLPMAVDSAALAHALVAWSSGHLSSTDESYRITALEARSASLRALVSTIHSDDIACRETNTATSLVLLTSEVCLGDYSRWYDHLIGIKNMIMSSQSPAGAGGVACGPDALKQSPEGRWILRNFAYHDVLGSVTLSKQPLIKATYLQGITDVVDTYLGVAAYILSVISEISCAEPLTLAYHYESRNDSEPGLNVFRTLEKTLQDWACSPGTIPSLEALAYTYRSAALIYLYRRTYRALAPLSDLCSETEMSCTLLRSRIQAEVATALQHAACIPSTAAAETALLFPLFLAGAEATAAPHIDMVRSRLRLMLEKRPFQNISRAWEVLEKVWALRETDQGDVDWKEIVDQEDGGLLLT